MAAVGGAFAALARPAGLVPLVALAAFAATGRPALGQTTTPCPPEVNTCIGPIGPAIGAVASFGSPVSPMMAFIYDKLSDEERKRHSPLAAYTNAAGSSADAAASRAIARTLGMDAGEPALGDLTEGRNADLAIPLSSAPEPVLLWARAVARVGSSEQQGKAAAMDLTGGAGFVGIDLPYDAATRYGLAAGYSRATLDTDGAADLDADGYHASAYVTHAEGPWRMRAIATYAYYDLDSTRSIPFGRETTAATASYDAHNLEALAEISRVWNVGALAVEPYLALGLSWLDTAAYRESARDGTEKKYLVAVQSHSETWPYTIVGARIAGQFDAGWATLVPNLDLGWRHVFGDVSPDLIYSMAEFDFAVSGIPIAEDSLLVGAGIDALIAANGWRTSLKYIGEIAEKAQLHTFSAGVAIPF